MAMGQRFLTDRAHLGSGNIAFLVFVIHIIFFSSQTEPL